MWKSFFKKERRGVIRAWARRDEEARVWYVVKCDLPGIAAEAESLEELAKAIMAMASDLQEEGSGDTNARGDHHQVPIELLSRFENHAHC